MSLTKEFKEKTKFRLKQQAIRMGFLACGVSRAEQLQTEARHLENWLNEGKHGQMQYMERHFEKRTDPRKLVPGARSVVSLLMNYYPRAGEQPDKGFKISRYAYGTDYHHVVKERMKELWEWLEKETGTPVEGRAFVDSAPVMDKAWAARAGLGWLGKNTNLLTREVGSYYFIGEMIIDLELPPDGPTTDHCGNCTRCIDACPTGALEPYNIDARKCISYLTIELKEETPPEYHQQLEGWAWGCDICQEVCPWNRFTEPQREDAFNLLEEVKHLDLQELGQMSNRAWKKKMEKSPLSRVKRDKMISNITLALASKKSDKE